VSTEYTVSNVNKKNLKIKKKTWDDGQ